jgi:hypothetical protein
LPLSVKARVEVYSPDLPKPIYQELLRTLAEEFTFSFGGCTIIRGLDGNYLSKFGQIISDRINLIYTDTPFDFQENFAALSNYSDELRKSAFKALEEEAILVAVHEIYHSI